MASKGLRTQLFEIGKLKNLARAYSIKFNKMAIPYVLPDVEYVGSYSSNLSRVEPAKVYVAIPIKNQSEIIFSVLKSLCDSLQVEFKVGLLLDNCTDETESEIHRFISEYAEGYPHLRRIDFLKSSGELFEATCENILFEYCSEEFFMSLQADIYLNDSKFVTTAIDAFHQNPDLFGISGRARVSYSRELNVVNSKISRVFLKTLRLLLLGKYKKVFLGPSTKKNGYFGDIAQHPNARMIFTRKQLRTLYPGEAIIRGPIMWRTDLFLKLGGLNDISYFLGRDDCDLSLRARVELNKFVAYLPAQSYSIKESGTTRKRRSQETLEEMQSRETLAQSHPGVLNYYWENGGTLPFYFEKKIHIN